jgi:hypothetical protein
MKRTLSTLAGASVLATGLMALAPSQAQAAACQTGGITGGFGLAPLSPICYGVLIDNNESAADLNNVNGFNPPGSSNPIPVGGAWGYTDWSFIAKVDTPGGQSGTDGAFLTINESANPSGTQAGTWQFTNFEIGKQYALVVKGGTSWSAYGFNATATSSSGDWSAVLAGLVNNGGQTPNLSHFSIYERGTPVPEPLTLLGSGIALGFGMYTKRKLNGQKAKI